MGPYWSSLVTPLVSDVSKTFPPSEPAAAAAGCAIPFVVNSDDGSDDGSDESDDGAAICLRLITCQKGVKIRMGEGTRSKPFSSVSNQMLRYEALTSSSALNMEAKHLLDSSLPSGNMENTKSAKTRVSPPASA